ncbi:MAG: hypothetical protein H6817_06770 [Phycisphaerales bacterium]|nr:hypothetical protein [Phycisphaerales bacterium]
MFVQTLNTLAKLGDDALPHVLAHRLTAKRFLHLSNETRVFVPHRQIPSTAQADNRSPRRILALPLANDSTRLINDDPSPSICRLIHHRLTAPTTSDLDQPTPYRNHLWRRDGLLPQTPL